MGISAPFVLAYVKNVLQPGSGLVRDLIQKGAEASYDALSLCAFLRCARYGLIDSLVYLWRVTGGSDGDSLLYVPLHAINLWYTLSICQIISNELVDPVLTLVAIGWLTNIDWKALECREWFQ